jgi:hypothetical protein
MALAFMAQQEQLVSNNFGPVGESLMKALMVFLITAMAACGHSSDEEHPAKKAGKVPMHFFRASDPAFSKNQDTVFYKAHPFSGLVYDNYPNRDTAFILSYLNGLQEGITRKWYPNKQLMEERLYINGHKEGVHRGWWPDGKPKFFFEVSDDEYTGLFKEWYKTGQIAKIFHYKDGQEQGSEKMWWQDGKIRANYVIVNGEKFGLCGQKLCVNKNLKQDIK